MTEEKLVELMSEARLISAADNILYPLIEKKIQQRLDLACGKFLAGERDFVAEIAYISAFKEILGDLKSKQNQGNKAIQALHEKEKNKN